MTRNYPKEFYVQRKRVLERDNYRCIACWRGPHRKKEEYWQSYGLRVYTVNVDLRADVDVHHVAYWVLEIDRTTLYDDRTIPDELLVTLCDSCHGKAGTCDKHSPFHKIIEDYVRALRVKAAGKIELANKTPVTPVEQSEALWPRLSAIRKTGE